MLFDVQAVTAGVVDGLFSMLASQSIVPIIRCPKVCLAPDSALRDSEVLQSTTKCIFTITMSATRAPGRDCRGYCRKYCEGLKLGRKLGHL